MDLLPWNIMFDIWSRMPVKSLARFRCVLKEWCEYLDDGYLGVIHGERVIVEPTLIMFHQNPSYLKNPLTLCFHIINNNKFNDDHHVLKSKKKPDLEFGCKSWITTSSHYEPSVQIRGSCNGLLFISQDNRQVVTSLVVIHPLKKQCYELPPLPLCKEWYFFRDSCVLGFDVSTNTMKMVCVVFAWSCFAYEPWCGEKESAYHGASQVHVCSWLFVLGCKFYVQGHIKKIL